MVRLTAQDQKQFDKAKDLLESQSSNVTGFVRSLYSGKLPTSMVLPYPKQDPQEVTRTDELIQKLKVFLEQHVDPDQIDADQAIPDSVIKGLGELGVLGMTVPKAYGGGGFSYTAYCRVLEATGSHCGSTAVFIGAHQSIGLKALVLMGTDAQKQQFLPDLATGKKIAAFCLSEPQTGLTQPTCRPPPG